jgi:lipid-binding SYLF domain-containing protein
MLKKEADLTVQKFKEADADLKKFFDESAGYAVFPSITKGGWFVGGAHGQGILYEKGVATGYVDVTHASIGLQFGGQTFSQIVFLETKEAVDNFKFGRLKFSGSLSAVAVRAGASKAVKYADHVAIFTLAEAGLMVEGAVGGQKFGFKPM